MPTTPKQLPDAKSPTIIAGIAGGYSSFGLFPVDESIDSTPEYEIKFISWAACWANFDYCPKLVILAYTNLGLVCKQV